MKLSSILITIAVLLLSVLNFADTPQYKTTFNTLLITGGRSYSFDEDYSTERDIGLPIELADWKCTRSMSTVSFKDGAAEKWYVDVTCNQVQNNKIAAVKAEASCEVNRSSNGRDGFTLHSGNVSAKIAIMCKVISTK
jgi:hypothetical protein